MEQGRSKSSSSHHLRFFSFHSLISCLTVFLLSIHGGAQSASAYTNYTVGDSLGWFDNLQVPKVNYQKWAAGKNFSLGDFLIFNTDKNHSVVQTYNMTTYRRCDDNDAENDDTIEWSTGEPEFSNAPVTVAAPLLKEGPTYFFSGNYDGEQCKHGQHFKITVAHGQGLPDSLKSPSQEAPAPADPDEVPDSTIPSNFDNPKDTGAVKQVSEGSKTMGVFLTWVLVGLLIVFG